LPHDYPLQIIPLNFGIKFKPPKIGLEYMMIGQPALQLKYEIALGLYLDNKALTTDAIVDRIFSEHKDYLHTRVVAQEQVRKLIERVKARLGAQTEHKENKQSNQVSAP
jgi:hypothetical protein